MDQIKQNVCLFVWLLVCVRFCFFVVLLVCSNAHDEQTEAIKLSNTLTNKQPNKQANRQTERSNLKSVQKSWFGALNAKKQKSQQRERSYVPTKRRDEQTKNKQTNDQKKKQKTIKNKRRHKQTKKLTTTDVTKILMETTQ